MPYSRAVADDPPPLPSAGFSVKPTFWIRNTPVRQAAETPILPVVYHLIIPHLQPITNAGAI